MRRECAKEEGVCQGHTPEVVKVRARESKERGSEGASKGVKERGCEGASKGV